MSSQLEGLRDRLPLFKSREAIHAFEIKDIVYCCGEEGETKIHEADYYGAYTTKPEPLSYQLHGQFVDQHGNVEIVIDIDIAFFKKYDPRIGGYFVLNEELEGRYMTGYHFRAYFSPEKGNPP